MATRTSVAIPSARAARRGRTCQLPVYVVHYPPLSGRRKRLRGLLRAAGTREVTWVLCGNRDEIGALPPAIQRCLGTDLRFGLPTAKYRFGAPLAPGQISTSLKFLLAFRDIRQRDIDAALMLEDDVMVTPRLWNLLGAFALPSDADILWLSGNWRGKRWHVRCAATCCNHMLGCEGRSGQ